MGLNRAIAQFPLILSAALRYCRRSWKYWVTSSTGTPTSGRDTARATHRATTRELRGGHASPRIHTGGRARWRTRCSWTTSSPRGPHATSDDIGNPVMAGDPPSPLPASSASRPAEGLISAGATGPPWGDFGSGPWRYDSLVGSAVLAFSIRKLYRDKAMEGGAGLSYGSYQNSVPGRGVDLV